MALSLTVPHGHTPGFLTHSPAGQGLGKLSLLCQMVTYLTLETSGVRVGLGGSLVAEPSPATLARTPGPASLDLPPRRLPDTPARAFRALALDAAWGTHKIGLGQGKEQRGDRLPLLHTHAADSEHLPQRAPWALAAGPRLGSLPQVEAENQARLCSQAPTLSSKQISEPAVTGRVSAANEQRLTSPQPQVWSTGPSVTSLAHGAWWGVSSACPCVSGSHLPSRLASFWGQGQSLAHRGCPLGVF